MVSCYNQELCFYAWLRDNTQWGFGVSAVLVYRLFWCIASIAYFRHPNIHQKNYKLKIIISYLIRTNFREALISRFSRFSRFVKNREIKDSLKLGYAKIKHAKFNTLL